MKCKFKKATALVLSLAFILMAFAGLPLTASAATEEIEVYLIAYPRGGGTDTWGHPHLTLMNGWSNLPSNYFTAKAAENKGMQVVYCVQPNVPLETGNQSPEILPDNFLNTYNNGALTPSEIQVMLSRILQYGYTGVVTFEHSDNEITNMIATQLLVWETIVGERGADFGHINPPANLNSVTDYIRSDHPLRSLIFSHYNRIVSSVQNHGKIPSFMRDSKAAAIVNELKWDGSKYAVTLNDTNGVLSGFNFSTTTQGVSFSKSGNSLTISTTTPPTGDIEITATKTGSTRRGLTFWCSNKIEVHGSVQGLVMSGQELSDPVTAYVKAKVSTGTLNIVKATKNNDGKVGGFQFRVTKDGANIGTFTSGNDGRISIPNLVAGWYKVEEINLSDEFVKPTPNPVDVEIKGGQTATVNFSNIKKLGIITVQKTNSNPVMGDYSLEKAEFTVKDKNGNTVDTIITDPDGRGQSKPLPLSTYTVFESKAPWGFVIDKNVYTRTLSGAQGTAEIVYCPEITVPERPQTGQVKITKLDSETAATAQGDATLSGAVFDLLDKDGNQIERLYCGDSVSVTSKEIPLGNGYVIKEVTPPRGYTLSEKTYTVNIDYAGQEATVNLKSVDVGNTVIKGRISIIKHSDDPDPAVDPENPQVQQPLDGIVFRVWLSSSGSYENAKASERDEITTNENGWAMTKDLPYGTYTVEEIKGEPEHKICEPFNAYITDNDRTYYYNVENPAYFGKVKIIKTDATTGKSIPQAGIEFKVKNTDTGAWVEQKILYPIPTTLTSYFTNAEGWLVMPQELRHGNFELWEVQSPYGYLLSEKPVPFKVTSANPAPVLEVTMPNAPAMGKVTIEKTGEMLTGANEIVGKSHVRYIPRYEVRSLPGVVFDIIARTDIVTPDGTTRAKAGDVVDTITTDADGKAESKLLFLGDYYAIERQTVPGMVLNTVEHDFSLVYQDQLTPIVTAQVGVYNERQKAAVTLEKMCEFPENAAEDFNPYADILFGLFAREDILTADGTVAIAKDALLEYVTFDKDGKAAIQTDLPIAAYYVQELQTGAGYALDEKQYDFSFEYAGPDIAIVEIAVNGGNPIENRLQRGSLKVVKTFEGRETAIPGVPFTITGITTVGTSVEINSVTDERGEIVLEDLLVGNYTVRELESDLTAGYVLSEEQTATVAPEQIAEMTIHNTLMRGDLRIIKTFEGKTVPLAGVKFTVTGKTLTGAEYSEEFETDEQGQIFLEGLLAGDYKIKEIASYLTVGYVLSEEQAAVIAHEQVTELQIENKLIRGNAKLIKTDKATGAKLAGAVFELYGPDGELLGVYTTDENGEIFTENLAYGSGYKWVETEAPTGYKLDKTEISFDITENGATVELSAVNEKIPEKPGDNPKTGDNSNPALWFTLLGISAGALILTFILQRRNKKSGAR